jgi:hypothetical protein
MRTEQPLEEEGESIELLRNKIIAAVALQQILIDRKQSVPKQAIALYESIQKINYFFHLKPHHFLL